MHELHILKDLVIILGAAVLVVATLRRIGLPSIAGFILTGVFAGPTALGLVDDTHEVEILAEVGVILLLFGIGIELSLDRLRRLWKAVLLGGGIQVVSTVAVGTFISHLLGVALETSILVGCVIAVSSTAIVLRGLSDRGELDTSHGRLAVGILVFQDLCVVPMILAVPILAGQGGTAAEVVEAIGLSVAIMVGVVLAAIIVVPRLLAYVAQTRQRDLFILTVFLICFGTAWAVSLADISLALGAFLAGLVVAGSEYRHQALSDLIPMREVLASLFFVSVGMLLDVSDILEHVVATVGLLLAILLGKFLLVLATALLLRLPLRVAILSAATLSQVGEFSFVLLNAASGTDLLDPVLAHNLLVAIILSMLLTPLGIAFGPHLAARATRVPWLNRMLGAEPPGVDAREPHDDHVIMAGYGMAGRELCAALRSRDIPYVAVDSNPENVRSAREAGDRAVLGDVTDLGVLKELGCHRARLVIFAINDPEALESAVGALRIEAPQTPILVRAQYAMDEAPMRAAGVTDVVIAEVTASAALVDATLAHLGVEPRAED